MSYPAISLATATVGRHRCPQKRLQTARQPPVYPNSSPDHRACNSLTPFRCPHAVHPCPSVDSGLAQGETLGQACRRIGVSDHTFYRWRREYGGLKVDQAKRLRDMEGENARLRRAVADLTVDNQILKEAARGNF